MHTPLSSMTGCTISGEFVVDGYVVNSSLFEDAALIYNGDKPVKWGVGNQLSNCKIGLGPKAAKAAEKIGEKEVQAIMRRNPTDIFAALQRHLKFDETSNN